MRGFIILCLISLAQADHHPPECHKEWQNKDKAIVELRRVESNKNKILKNITTLMARLNTESQLLNKKIGDANETGLFFSQCLSKLKK